MINQNQTQKKRFIIVTSEEEDYTDAARLIEIEGNKNGINSKILNISHKNKKFFLQKALKINAVIFLLTNDEKIIDYFARFCDSGEVYIINNVFWKKSLTKREVQKVISKNDVLVPNNFDLTIGYLKNKLSYPLYIKNKSHCMPVIIVRSRQSLVNFMKSKSLVNLKDWYLEENVEFKSSKICEVYFIDGKITGVKNRKISPLLIKVLEKICEVLELEVFSAGFFVESKTNKYWCIDVNPAPALFKSEQSRKLLVKFVNRKILSNIQFDNKEIKQDLNYNLTNSSFYPISAK